MVTRTKKIFVGGLSTTTTLEEVRAYFAKFGEVKNNFILNKVQYRIQTYNTAPISHNELYAASESEYH